MGQSVSGSNGVEGVLHIPQTSWAKASPTDCLVSYLGYSLWESYFPAEMQSVYSTALADWTTGHSLEESYSSAEM